MKYVDEWKQEELERSIEWYNHLLVKYNEMLEETKMECSYWNDRNYFIEKKGMTPEQVKEEHDRLRSIKKNFEMDYKSALATMEKFMIRDKENCGYEVYAVEQMTYGTYERKCYRVQFLIDEEKEKEVLMKLIDKHFDTLQAKVEKKIGKIVEIESLGGWDYMFIGTEGQCKVEVILAGGYNIQRLHTRWIIKK